jgi:hypothetical protein
VPQRNAADVRSVLDHVQRRVVRRGVHLRQSADACTQQRHVLPIRTRRQAGL